MSFAVLTEYRVEISGNAKRDVQQIHDYIARDKPGAAAKWVRNFERHARSLATMPLRYEIISEADDVGYPYRHVIFGNYRIIYRVEGQQVTVVHVLHAARQLLRQMLNLSSG